IEFDRVSKRFGAVVALETVSLQVAPGEFFTLLGPSGCGKTTTLRLLAGLEEPGQGTIRIAGEAMNGKPPYQRNLGMVFQHYALFPHLSVERNVAYGLERRRVRPSEIVERVRKTLALVKLDPGEFAARRPAQLSGGERQRVALARALVTEPAILLLDEPLGALDLALRKAMQLELKQLRRALGTTFVYVTHDQDEALTMSDRIAVMDRGRVVQVGSPREIYERPRTGFVARFIGDSNLVPGPAGSTIAVRPERIELLPPGAVPAGRTAMPATVSEVIYQGERITFLLEAPAGLGLAVSVPNDGRSPGPGPWRPGDRVLAAWRPEDAWVLEEG
ncbi:MAG TPA: ABC transporter ATP-binding protein, partial [Gemmatimonadales bacterium]|nr:ABC transporter ATP-binding protein [Gemmatimonadales bacterium]